ncbi:MAG: hypothetical protein A3A96_02670 [Candidatus Zambryskibacteria bacterium RIFCSPLOWO2_01_FULL_39_39]|uniref:Glycerophosphoryl diester phosphodiesterase membrane domain-containing protein n=1 Tax=Candidatus Zambryskibacteria bacterium RIFCSPLOWO2_01_FULL_39_39 TaxID=1802758 RepID=A0A1G2TZM4_9BACT|nr:MAG: hypothetical protein A2644_02385 [Candidatus Zambryskibacteria bacterium RIFCSPHIGHO2_01_FULL_39_63]OHA94852.1 MAG: hypothetical protein A3B88_04430 [Candidatus Zambryskibacteria bacterium RIFCSPHIGHO2_02_FULL_39_19]OHA98342.1 MAG: hypothetical protein A3F20_02120 [Candidatus Zambryskibacteria bacterium RIFCSPHIGHO2_12_FULL_39_21]OHB02727.1 MAG: hypothetical protein A3A96_02670 [Candidatus Zambryskibacteria bacterium RIFCSPLOWO2_01_FULL_39_39]
MFSIKASLKYGWEKFKTNKEIAILTTLLVFAVSSLGNMDSRSIFWTLAVVIFSIIIRIGYTKIFLKISDGENTKFVEIFQEYKIFWRYLGVSILCGLAVLGGLILLIIPGIIWAVRFSFAGLIVVDTNIGPIVAMKESYAITKGKFWKLLGFFVVLGLINILGVLVLIVGLLVSVPVSIFAWIYVYRELSKTKAGLLETSSPQTI